MAGSETTLSDRWVGWCLGIGTDRRRAAHDRVAHFLGLVMDLNLHSLSRQLIELKIEHADLDSLIDTTAAASGGSLDELSLRRLKKRRLLLRDRIARLELDIEPPEPA